MKEFHLYIEDSTPVRWIVLQQWQILAVNRGSPGLLNCYLWCTKWVKSNGTVRTLFLYRSNGKRDDFEFDIVNFPFLDGEVPRHASYVIYISQLFPFARASSRVNDFISRNKFLPAKLLKQSYRYHNSEMFFSKFYRRHHILIEKYVSLKKLVQP